MKRDRKLLLNKREIRHLAEDTKQPGYTIVPTLLFIDANGRAKVDIALCRGKKQYRRKRIGERWTGPSKDIKEIGFRDKKKTQG